MEWLLNFCGNPDLYILLESGSIDYSCSFCKIKHLYVQYPFSFCMPLVECVAKNNFLIPQSKHMLWVLKRTVSMRWFF